MRKSLIAMLIAFSFAVVSCGGTKEEVVTEEVEVVVTEEVLEGEVEATEEVVEAEVEG